MALRIHRSRLDISRGLLAARTNLVNALLKASERAAAACCGVPAALAAWRNSGDEMSASAAFRAFGLRFVSADVMPAAIPAPGSPIGVVAASAGIPTAARLARP